MEGIIAEGDAKKSTADSVELYRRVTKGKKMKFLHVVKSNKTSFFRNSKTFKPHFCLIYKEKIIDMFGLFKRDPKKKLEKEYRALLEKARDVQRSGDLRKYAVILEEAEKVQEKIFALED